MLTEMKRMAVERKICPRCKGDFKLLVDLDSAITTKLHDRFMALTPIEATLECVDCGLRRQAIIDGFDVALDTGRLEFGDIQILGDDDPQKAT